MAVKNLVSGVLAQSITTSTTNVLVKIAENVDSSGVQSFFPTPPFYITIMPKTPAVGVANRLDSEILQVTAVGNDQSGNASLTCVRGQRDTTAKAFDVGSIVTVGVYADDAVFLGGEGSAVGTPAPWIETSDIKNRAITTDKIADNAVTSDNVNWATFDGSWHNITLNSDITVGNANFIHANNRWRYENGGRDIRIQLNVGNSNGTQVPAGKSKNFASPSQFSFMPSGKFMRLCGSGQASSLVWVEINTTSSSFVRFTPITGASSYCALDVLIPKP